MQENMWIDWLNKRGVTSDVISDFGLHIESRDDLGDSIVIPVMDETGQFSFNKYRRDPRQGDVKPKYKYDKGGRSTLYGAHKIKECSTVLVTEGELDTLTAWSANVPAVSSTGGAGTFLEEWKGLLEGKDVTLCFDNDEAGGAGMVKALKVLGGEAYVLFLPDRPGVKDLSDYVAGGGDVAELLRGRVRFGGLQDVMDDRAVRLAGWRSTYFHDAYIAAHTQPIYEKTERVFTGDTGEIARAKSYPVSELIKFNREHKACCIWHNEKSASMHYYKGTNSVYCFGCGRHGDAIDVIRQMKGCSFGEAIKALI